jgi:hypothetical protein
MTVGSDGALWFTELTVSEIGRITTDGTITEIPIPGNHATREVTSGRDGNLWFTEFSDHFFTPLNEIGEVVLNHPPIASAGGPYAVTYGGSLTLNASGASDPDGDPLTYSWTVNGHADAATGVQPTLTWSDLAALGIVPGQSYTVSVTVDDGHGHSATAAAALTANKVDQHIEGDWPVRAPGSSSVTLNLTSSSGLPVSYTVSGPATLSGQALIRSLNGDTGTQLGDWLAATFPRMFGVASGDLAGQTNVQVALYFQLLFATRGDKLEAQVLATALSVYVTNSTLAGGSYAAAYGFTVAAGGGAGLATFNVGSDGAVVGQANGATMTLMDILLAADQHATVNPYAVAGFVLYDGDQATRNLADDLFGRINDTGGI